MESIRTHSWEADDFESVSQIISILVKSKPIELSMMKGQDLTLQQIEQCVDDIQNIYNQVLRVDVSLELYEYRRNALSKLELLLERAKNRFIDGRLSRLRRELEDRKGREHCRNLEIQQLKSQLEQSKRTSAGGCEMISQWMNECNSVPKPLINDFRSSISTSEPINRSTGEVKNIGNGFPTHQFTTHTSFSRSNFKSFHPERIHSRNTHRQPFCQSATSRINFALQKNFVKRISANEFQRNFFVALKQPATDGVLLFESKLELHRFVKTKMLKKLADRVSLVGVFKFFFKHVSVNCFFLSFQGRIRVLLQ